MCFNAMEDFGNELSGLGVKVRPLQVKLRKIPLIPVGLVPVQLKPERGSTSMLSLLLVGVI